MLKIVAFSGISNSGKTTLIEGLCRILIPRFKVAVIKHDPKNKVAFEPSHKDSFKFFASGAEVAIVSPTQTTIRQHKMLGNDEIIGALNVGGGLDYVFIEGFKYSKYRRICVIRGDFEESEVKNSSAIATNSAAMADLEARFGDKAILNVDNHYEVLEWIDAQKW